MGRANVEGLDARATDACGIRRLFWEGYPREGGGKLVAVGPGGPGSRGDRVNVPVVAVEGPGVGGLFSSNCFG